mmetsp:Transcript_9571/g.30337  ORF Transcript_9571/g.30337 Transcript_9571/m.30337 type:complete len:266 (+) Transcript_9571:3602-4399(+)
MATSHPLACWCMEPSVMRAFPRSRRRVRRRLQACWNAHPQVCIRCFLKGARRAIRLRCRSAMPFTVATSLRRRRRRTFPVCLPPVATACWTTAKCAIRRPRTSFLAPCRAVLPRAIDLDLPVPRATLRRESLDVLRHRSATARQPNALPRLRRSQLVPCVPPPLSVADRPCATARRWPARSLRRWSVNGVNSFRPCMTATLTRTMQCATSTVSANFQPPAATAKKTPLLTRVMWTVTTVRLNVVTRLRDSAPRPALPTRVPTARS